MLIITQLEQLIHPHYYRVHINTHLETPLPQGWKTLAIDKYDGVNDRNEHVHIYLTQVSLYITKDAIFCKVFAISLKSTTLSWFTQLAHFSIDCFDTLTNQFRTKFSTPSPIILHITIETWSNKMFSNIRIFNE